MAGAIVRAATALLVILSSASRALADIPPQPDPNDPTMLLYGLAVVVAIATGIGYFLCSRQRK